MKGMSFENLFKISVNHRWLQSSEKPNSFNLIRQKSPIHIVGAGWIAQVELTGMPALTLLKHGSS